MNDQTQENQEQAEDELTLEEAAIETFVGDVMDIVAKVSKTPNEIAKQQIARAEVTKAVASCISAIASRQRLHMNATIEKATVKDGIKFEVTAAAGDATLGMLEDLASSGRMPVVIVQRETTEDYGGSFEEINQRGFKFGSQDENSEDDDGEGTDNE